MTRTDPMPAAPPPDDCDLLVVGSGAAGLCAAVTAAHHGLRVVVAEKADVLGGTTAWSGGWIWAPCNPVARRHGVADDPARVRTYLQAVQGNGFDAALVDAFLEAAPRMVGFLETEAGMRFDCGLTIPDTYGDLPGAGTGGRSLIARPVDGGRLGADLALLRPPLRETALWGMTIQAGTDLRAFLTATRSPRSALHVAGRLARHGWHLVRHGRGMDLRNGNALVAGLILAARAKGVDLRPAHAVAELVVQDGAVRGAVIDTPAGRRTIRAARGVVLAAGGFPHDGARRAGLFPHDGAHLSLAVPTATGDGLRLGEGAGGRQATALAAPGAWCPVSQVTWPDGRTGVFPHIIDRGKPGVIGVLADGRRFCNEGLGYHDYVAALLASVPAGTPKSVVPAGTPKTVVPAGTPEPAVPAGTGPESWLICDHRFLRRYGLGIVRPAPMPFGYWLRSGYLHRGRTLADLARACGIDADGLTATVAAFNDGARRGQDPAFHRGTTPYMRAQGDPSVTPNPCLAPLETAPFYAVRVVPGSFGTFAGLMTDGQARVLDADGAPIPGLYAAGTDMRSVMGGQYPAGGINLGPALTFGFVAGRHAAGVQA